MPQRVALLPCELFHDRVRQIAFQDFLARQLRSAIHAHVRADRSTGKSIPGLPKSSSRTIATALAGTATLGFVAAGLALWGVVVPFGSWRALAIASALVSLLLVALFWDRTLIVGPLIDATVLVVAILAAQLF